MSRFIAFAVFVTIATGSVVARHGENYVVDQYRYNVNFINAMMLNDQHWFSILRYKVKMQHMPAKHTDHFNVPTDRRDKIMVVNPFTAVVDLKMQNTMVNTEVTLVMEAVKIAMACSALRHISLQTIILEQIIIKENESVVKEGIAKLVKFMAQLAVDKLSAVKKPSPVISKLHVYLIYLLDTGKTTTLQPNSFNAINAELYDELTKVCHCPQGMGLYRPFIEEFSKPITPEELKKLQSLNTTEHVKDLAAIADLEHSHGKLNISPDITPEEFGNLELNELKKLFVVNRARMNYTYLNLGLKTLATLQWANILNENNF